MNRWLLEDTQHKQLFNLKYEFGQSHFISHETDLGQLFQVHNLKHEAAYIMKGRKHPLNMYVLGDEWFILRGATDELGKE